MPMIRARYPVGWNLTALLTKYNANWHCQKCGKPCRLPRETRDQLIERIEIKHPQWAPHLYTTTETEEFGAIDVPNKIGRFTLTVAHLNHQPHDCRPENLRAWCSVCHCQHDLKAMPLKKQLKLEYFGQLNLLTQQEP